MINKNYFENEKKNHYNNVAERLTRFASKSMGILINTYCQAGIRPALLYGTECWPVKKIFEHKMDVTEMRMLMWMCGHTLMDRIRNKQFRDKLGVAPIFGKMSKNRLRWF